MITRVRLSHGTRTERTLQELFTGHSVSLIRILKCPRVRRLPTHAEEARSALDSPLAMRRGSGNTWGAARGRRLQGPCRGGMWASLFHRPNSEDQLRPSRQLLHVPAGKLASRLRLRASPTQACLSSLPRPGWPPAQIPRMPDPVCHWPTYTPRP